LRVAEEVRTRDVVVDADFGATEPGEVFLSHVSASAIEAVCLLMVDSFDLETLMKVIPRRRFVGVQNRPLRDASANERSSLAFRIEDCRNRVTTAFTDHNYNLALAILVPGEAAVAAVYFLISQFEIAATRSNDTLRQGSVSAQAVADVSTRRRL